MIVLEYLDRSLPLRMITRCLHPNTLGLTQEVVILTVALSLPYIIALP
jgi:hypothetical protein